MTLAIMLDTSAVSYVDPREPSPYAALKLAEEITAPRLRSLLAELAELRRRGLLK